MSLNQFEVAAAVPVGHGAVVLLNFPTTGGNEVFDKVLAQILAGEFTALQQVGCGGEITGEGANVAAFDSAGDSFAVVGVALQALWEFKLMLDAVEATGESCSEDKVEIGVSAWDAVLDANGIATVVDDANGAGSVIHAPGRVQGCPGAFDVAFVGVDDRGIEGHEFGHFVENTRQELAHECGHMAFRSLVPEKIALAFAVPQAHMRVATATIFLVVPLGHEGCGIAHLVADFFHASLEKHGLVSRGDSLIIAQVHLVHARAMLAVVAFDKDSRIAHHTSNTAKQGIVGARLADGIAVKAGVERSQIGTEIFFTQRHLIFAEETKLQFGGGKCFVAHRTGALYDLIENVARRNSDGIAMLGP